MAKFSDEIGSAIISIRADVGRLKSDLSKATKEVQKSSSKMKTALKSVGAAFIGIFALRALKDVSVGIVKATADIEKMGIAFTAALGSSSKANKLIDELKTFAATTPFQLEGIASTTRVLINAGIEVKDITKNLRMLGDVAAGTNVPLTEIAAIFAKAQNKGKAFAEELNSMSERGVPIIRVLAEELDLTKQEVFDLGAKGKLTTDIIVAAFEKMTSAGGVFFELTSKQSQGLAGRFTTLKDNILETARIFGGVFQDEMKALLEVTLNIVMATNEWLSGIAKAVKALGGIRSMFKGLVNQFSSFVGLGRPFVKTMDTIEERMAKLGITFVETVDSIKEGSAVAGNAVEGQLGTATDSVSAKFAKIREENKKLFEDIRAKSKKGSEDISKFAKTMKDEFVSALEEIGSLLNKLFGVGGSSVGGMLLSKLGGAALGSLGDVFSGGLDKLFSGKGFANGGNPPVGQASVVGEKGPELFVPKGAGTIIPNDKLGGGGGMTVNVQPIFVGVDDRIQTKIQQAMPAMVNEAVNAVSNSIARGDRRFA